MPTEHTVVINLEASGEVTPAPEQSEAEESPAEKEMTDG